VSDLINATVILVRVPVYIDESADMLLLSERFWPQLDYRLIFGDRSKFSRRRIDRLQQFASLPSWVASSANSSMAFPMALETTSWVGMPLTHTYTHRGVYRVSLVVSGVTLAGGPVDKVTVDVDVLVRPRPRLGEVLGSVELVVMGPVYVGEPVDFVLFVENAQKAVSFQIAFGDERSTTGQVC